jgi:aldehyde dehydrogenase (NAD+)
MAEELDKPRHEALLADILPLQSALTWLERHARATLAPKALGGTPWWLRGCSARISRAPLGRVAILATWNYPVQLLGIQLAHALVAGNTVTVKPSERAPRTQALLLDLAERAGASDSSRKSGPAAPLLPPGTLTRAPATRAAGRDLLASTRFDHVVFTGSTTVGIEVAKALAPTLTPATLELSGRDSALVLRDARPKAAARAIWACTIMNSGQTCMGPRRALVHAAAYDDFCAELTRLAATATPRPLIDEHAAAHVHALCTDAISRGGRDAAASTSSTSNPPPPQGRLLRPTCILDCPPNAPLVEGRHFGPALAVVRVPSLARALEIHNACDQHLATSVFTRDTRTLKTLAPLLNAGLVIVNDCLIPASHPAVPITGIGASGLGSSRGHEGLLAMTRPLVVTIGPGAASRAHKPPPRIIVRGLAWFLRRWYGRGKDPTPAPTAPPPTSAAPPSRDASISPPRTRTAPAPTPVVDLVDLDDPTTNPRADAAPHATPEPRR